MKQIYLAAVALLALVSCNKPTTVEWTEGPVDPESGLGQYTLIVHNPPKDGNWTIWFSQFRIQPQMEEESQGSIEHVAGSLHKLYPTSGYGKTMTISYKARALRRQSWAPECFTLDIKGKEPVELIAKYNFLPVEEVAEFVYDPVELRVEDMIPQLKSVSYTEDSTTIDPEKVEYLTVNIVGKSHGWYKITVASEGVRAEAADEDGLWYARVTIDNLIRNAAGKQVPNMIIEDYPDLQYRGVMLDVSRNFTPKKHVLTLIDLLSHYKVNVLHLHLADDEGWRLEIKDLPELTSFSAFHALPEVAEDGSIKEVKALMPSYAGAFYPEQESTSNGYYTKEDFIEILKYAKERHITIITEMDTPGHSRAAIKAMEKYAERTGDTSYLLSEAADTSKYMSVQDYNDNAINVALPSTYKFMEKYIETLVEYYNEAGVGLPVINIGGDEVADGAWMGSPACQQLMAQNGWDSVHQLKAYYINRIMDITQSHGLKIAGWQEIALNMDDATIERLRSNMAYTNCWSTYRSTKTDEFPYIFANKGLNVVLSNMTNTYSDFAYNRSKLEQGHDWGGIIDERRSFSLNPFDVYKSVRWDDEGNMVDIKDLSTDKTSLHPEAKDHILGVQAQLWSETIRGFEDVTYCIFPKMLGLFERGWNANPAWAGTTVSDDPLFTGDFNRFYSIIEAREYPYFNERNINYRKHNQ